MDVQDVSSESELDSKSELERELSSECSDKDQEGEFTGKSDRPAAVLGPKRGSAVKLSTGKKKKKAREFAPDAPGALTCAVV